MCSSFASLADVLEWRERQRVIPEHERIWGPVSEVEAAKVGCIRAAASGVIMCAIAPSVLDGAVQCIPVELLPRAAKIIANSISATSKTKHFQILRKFFSENVKPGV